jgi:hypothetical protein
MTHSLPLSGLPQKRPASWEVWAPYVALACLAFLVCWIYRQPPRLGDDLDYFRLATELRMGVDRAWSEDSFHDLRWPVWGLIWLLSGIFGAGPEAYYLQPALYLAAGAGLVFWLAGRVGLPLWGRVCAGVFFVMHPMVDASIIRPMPDLSEGFWVGLAFAFWLAMLGENRRMVKVAFCCAVGIALAAAQANRITGAFAVPVLLVCTLALYPRQFGWLVLCGVFAGGFVLVEAFVYFLLTGDFLHSIHANLGARGRKGTEPMPVWMFPLRFLPALFRHAPEILMNLLAVGGAIFFWRGGGRAARAVVLYALVYYLTYSCALQSFWPPRPMVRDGDRFLASLAIPLSVLAVGGPMWVWTWLPAGWRSQPSLRWLERRAWIFVLVAFVGLMLLSRRPIGVPDYLAEIGEIVRATPAGSVVVSHPPMRTIAQLADARAASAIDWRLFHNVLEPSDELNRALEEAEGVWLSRKHAWLRNRKRSETGEQHLLPILAPYLMPPTDPWATARSVLKVDVPEFAFLARGKATAVPIPSIFPVPEIPWPHHWEFSGKKKTRWQSPRVEVPESLRGEEFFLALEQSSDQTEAVRGTIDFVTESGRAVTVSLRPYFFPASSPDFFVFRVPDDAVSMRVRMDVASKTQWITVHKAVLYHN